MVTGGSFICVRVCLSPYGFIIMSIYGGKDERWPYTHYKIHIEVLIKELCLAQFPTIP